LLFCGIALITSLLIAFSFRVQANEREFSLPPLQIHPLPATLVQWQDHQNLGDYFSQIQATPAGYLIWSEFPIKIYLYLPVNSNPMNATTIRLQKWAQLVRQAIQEWAVYLPLSEVQQPDLADIIIEPTSPPLETKINPETGELEVPRARSAQTTYEFYLKEKNPPILSYRMTIQMNPGQNDPAILGATRHELGHALGIWGHSSVETDTMYFSQVRQFSPISSRDINTLKKIYQQPTRVGWEVIIQESNS
jgi:predicted Zn-dependent protease